MQARSLLMIEHRLIERMVARIEARLSRIQSEGDVDPDFLDTVVDFIRTYADRTHHGKEEDILFAELSKRTLSAEDDRLMKELSEEHVRGRKITSALADASARYRRGEEEALEDVVGGLRQLVDMYPDHIRKEDEVFFPAARRYLTDEEDMSILEGFREFDRKVIHEIYRSVVEELETGS
jgi:hemerythrin-like domain-containing protein